MNHTRTLKSTILRALIAPVVFTAALATGYTVAPLIGATSAPESAHQGITGAPAATGSPAALIEAHDCWSGPAPADMVDHVPGHVVVTLPGGAEPSYAGPRIVGLALDQLFAGKAAGLTIHAFCR